MSDGPVLVRWFDDPGTGGRPEVGGKCDSLGQLLTAGIDVPPGFVVTVAAFEAFREQGDLRIRLKRLVRETDPVSATALYAAHRQATELVASTQMPPVVVEAIRSGYVELCRRQGSEDLPVAIRSSAVAEDGDATSFAGQQETFLWVIGTDDVVEHVRSCWASLYTPQAIAYRHQLSEEQAYDATRIAVGVQAMVDPEASGVAFTVSPRTGDRSVVAINASWGLGDAVVSGEVTPDEYWLSKVDMQITGRTIARKTKESRPAPDGHGVETIDVADDRRDVACMDDESILTLAALALRVEQHYGCPQDIEWALVRPTANAASRLVVLQSRPETTWKARRDEARKKAATTAGGYLGMIAAARSGSAG